MNNHHPEGKPAGIAYLSVESEKNSETKSEDITLRQKAEELLVNSGNNPSASAGENIEQLLPATMQSIIHDLRVHQIELEMQNEELRRTQLELDISRQRYFDLYELAPVGYCTLSESGLIIEANLTLANMLGLPRGVLPGQPITHFIVPACQDVFYLYRQKLFRTLESQSCEICMANHEGKEFWVNLTTTLSPDISGQLICRSVLNDISDRKQSEIELLEAKSRAETANKAKSEFLSRMSHELRTPLNAIIGFAELMLTDSNEKKISDYTPKLETIIRSGWHLTRLIDDLLNLSTIEAKKTVLHIEDIDMQKCLDKCFELILPLARKHRLELHRNDAAWEGVMIRADAFRLGQVLINLLANAVKYNREGGSITVSGLRHEGRLRIQVSDTGEGIRKELLDSLFQPFSRLTDRPYHIEGAGIGLSIARQLTELMGGTIGVESVFGEGSTFWVEFPFIETSEPVKSPAQSWLNTTLAIQHFDVDENLQKTVIYIEDNLDHIRLMQAIILQMANISLFTAPTAALGIEMARTSRADLVICDICLPEISGIEVLELLQHDPDTSKIPVMALSANANTAEIEKGLRAGFTHYLTKPLNVPLFMNTLQELLVEKIKI